MGYDCAINSIGQTEIIIYGNEYIDDYFTNNGHITNKLTVRLKSNEWEAGIVGNNYKTNDAMEG